MELYECHGHIYMDGVDFAASKERYRVKPDEADIRQKLDTLRRAGVTFFRDGGDPYGASELARQLAPEYGIDYRSPVFAIYPKGRYGRIIGRSCSTREEYRELLDELETRNADFVKLVFSGILEFDRTGHMSCEAQDEQAIRYTVEEAHKRGFAVMAHCSGASAVLAAAAVGTDSIEHGYYTGPETITQMAERNVIWVPTLAPVDAFRNREGSDPSVVEEILRNHMESLRTAQNMGVTIASGSDAGAFGVPHGAGILREQELLQNAGITADSVLEGNMEIRQRFQR